MNCTSLLRLLVIKYKRKSEVINMTKAQMLDDLLSDGNGYLTSDAAGKIGISNRYFSDYVQSRQLIRAAHGIYYSRDTWKDDRL